MFLLVRYIRIFNSLKELSIGKWLHFFPKLLCSCKAFSMTNIDISGLNKYWASMSEADVALLNVIISHYL